MLRGATMRPEGVEVGGTVWGWAMEVVGCIKVRARNMAEGTRIPDITTAVLAMGMLELTLLALIPRPMTLIVEVAGVVGTTGIVEGGVTMARQVTKVVLLTSDHPLSRRIGGMIEMTRVEMIGHLRPMPVVEAATVRPMGEAEAGLWMVTGVGTVESLMEGGEDMMTRGRVGAVGVEVQITGVEDLVVAMVLLPVPIHLHLKVPPLPLAQERRGEQALAM